VPEHESEDNGQQPQEAVTETNQPAVEADDAEDVNVAQGEANSFVREYRQADFSKFQQKFSHAHQSIERLQKLGEALEHSQISITELSNQLSKPESLEIQLAKTEEVTNLQQQAIAQLKEKLSEQQEYVKDETLRTLLTTIENFMRSQQLELAHLKAELILERAKTQTEKQLLQQELNQIYTDLESEQQQVRSLEAQIFSARSLAGNLEMQLLSAQQEIEALQEKLSDRIFSLQTQEYQAQLQQWKKQCEENQHQVQHLQETLKKLLPDGSENILELLINPQNAIEVQTISTVISEQEASTGSHKLQVDLPGFLKKPSTVQPPPEEETH
jgi:chromosome segregation ATPase